MASSLTVTKDVPNMEPTKSAPDALPHELSAVLQEQLGLQVEPSKGEVDVLVIEHAEQPSAN